MYTSFLSRAAVALLAQLRAETASARLPRRPLTYTSEWISALSSPRASESTCVSRESRSGGVAAFFFEPIALKHLVSVLSEVLIEQ